MAGNQQITSEVLAKLHKLGQQKPRLSNREIGRRLGLHDTTVLKYRDVSALPAARVAAAPKVVESDEVAGDSRTITLPSTRIQTLEQLVEHCKIDLAVWEVERFICNKWEVGAKIGPQGKEVLTVEPLFQVKAFLRRRREVEFARREVESLRKESLKFFPKFPVVGKARPASGTLTEFAIYDHHIGSLIWGAETGWADYDTKIAENTYKDALGGLVQRTRPYGSDRALIVLGNDQQNADNRAGTTEHGTPQNMDSRYQKVFEVNKRVSRWAIDTLLGEYGSVDVIMIPGNHDPLSTWHLGDTLQSIYGHSKQVRIDNRPRYRKYFRYGKVMLGFTHGNTGKLEEYPQLMAAEEPEMWGATRWREMHTADKHHRRTLELKGATVRILPSMRPPCSWSSEHAFVGTIRASEAHVWHEEQGHIGAATYSILGDKR